MGRKIPIIEEEGEEIIKKEEEREEEKEVELEINRVNEVKRDTIEDRKERLRKDILKRNPVCGLIVVDNFYNNPIETRNYILTQDFSVKGNYPGKRTISYANEHLRDKIQEFIRPFGEITDFPIPKNDSENEKIYNGAFQYTTSRDRSWVHVDSFNNWAAVLYLTPDAPLSSGTGFYRYKDGSMGERDARILENKEETDKWSQDMTKWELVDRVANVFNRLVIFDATRYHMSMDYFGDSIENGRLFQVFFFSTGKKSM